ncbi:MAG: hypothetical protein NVSMB17_11260 [Candidatus Dormibacteria bacterium]
MATTDHTGAGGSTGERALNGKVGPVRVHWPTTVGYYGGVGLAVAVGMIEWPVAIFIGAVPVVKMLKDRSTPTPLRYFVDMFQGAAKPVGGDGDSMMELESSSRTVARRTTRAVQRKAPGVRNPRPLRAPVKRTRKPTA